MNRRHCDFQSHALPTELPGQGRGCWPAPLDGGSIEAALDPVQTSPAKFSPFGADPVQILSFAAAWQGSGLNFDDFSLMCPLHVKNTGKITIWICGCAWRCIAQVIETHPCSGANLEPVAHLFDWRSDVFCTTGGEPNLALVSSGSGLVSSCFI